MKIVLVFLAFLLFVRYLLWLICRLYFKHSSLLNIWFGISLLWIATDLILPIFNFEKFLTEKLTETYKFISRSRKESIFLSTNIAVQISKLVFEAKMVLPNILLLSSIQVLSAWTNYSPVFIFYTTWKEVMGV